MGGGGVIKKVVFIFPTTYFFPFILGVFDNTTVTTNENTMYSVILPKSFCGSQEIKDKQTWIVQP